MSCIDALEPLISAGLPKTCAEKESNRVPFMDDCAYKRCFLTDWQMATLFRMKIVSKLDTWKDAGIPFRFREKQWQLASQTCSIKSYQIKLLKLGPSTGLLIIFWHSRTIRKQLVQVRCEVHLTRGGTGQSSKQVRREGFNGWVRQTPSKYYLQWKNPNPVVNN